MIYPCRNPVRQNHPISCANDQGPRGSAKGIRQTRRSSPLIPWGLRVQRHCALVRPFPRLVGGDVMPRKQRARRAAAAVEFAVLAPFLAFLFVIAVDWARVFYYSIAVRNCARNGALYLSQQQSAKTTSSPYTDSGYVNLYVKSAGPVTAAALADAPDLTPTPTVTSGSGSDGYGPYVEVTVSYPFQTVTNFSVGNFLVPSSTNVTRTVRMYVPPESPK